MKKIVKKSVAKIPAKKTVAKKPMMKAGGSTLKSVPTGNKGLSKLPTAVRNKMGYMKKGGPRKSLKRYQGDEGGSEVVTPTSIASTPAPVSKTFADTYKANLAAGLKPRMARKEAEKELGYVLPKQKIDPNAVISAAGNVAGSVINAAASRSNPMTAPPFKKGGIKKKMQSGGITRKEVKSAVKDARTAEKAQKTFNKFVNTPADKAGKMKRLGKKVQRLTTKLKNK